MKNNVLFLVKHLFRLCDYKLPVVSKKKKSECPLLMKMTKRLTPGELTPMPIKASAPVAPPRVAAPVAPPRAAPVAPPRAAPVSYSKAAVPIHSKNGTEPELPLLLPDNSQTLS